MKNMILILAGLCALGLLHTTPALAQAATDVNCDGCVHSGDIATNGVRRSDIQNFSINTTKLNNHAVTTPKIKPGAVTVDKLSPELSNTIGEVSAIAEEQASQNEQLAALEYELQTATDYGRRGMHNGSSAISVLERLVATLGLTCAEANYGLFLGCTQVTAGDGTVWLFSQLLPELSLAMIQVDDVPTLAGMPYPLLFVAQTNDFTGGMVVAGTANLFRWTYRDEDDTARLVDDCDNPTVAMSPASNPGNGTSSRWRLNNGSYYYVPYDPNTGTQTMTGQMDVTGQTVGIVKNIHPFGVFDVNEIVWCEMSDQVTGIYAMFDLQPYPFSLNEARFSMPMTPN